MKTTLNPFENAKRTANGAGGGSATIPPATADTRGGVKIGDGINVTEDGTISVSYAPPAYSLDEVDTGRKWIDGKNIYEKVVPINLTTVDDATTTIGTGFNYIETMIHSVFIAIKANSRGCESNCTYCYVTGDGDLRIHNIERWTELTSAYVIIQYTKAGA